MYGELIRRTKTELSEIVSEYTGHQSPAASSEAVTDLYPPSNPGWGLMLVCCGFACLLVILGSILG